MGAVYSRSDCAKVNMKIRYLIGIDEVGRGPLAGPVMVGAVLVPVEFDWALVPGVGDSKRVSAAQRHRIAALARELKGTGRLDYEVAAVRAQRIDTIGITVAIKEALSRALAAVVERHAVSPAQVLVKLDGGLNAPSEYRSQETIIKGDATEPVIGLASIVAKVTRDTHMERLATQRAYAAYGFAAHKGYGTKAHRAAIVAHGLSREHRASFCHFCRGVE